MADLNTAQRHALKESDFALPGRRYPIENEAHARAALARVAANGTPSEQAIVRHKVAARYPQMEIKSGLAK